jgi:hypothetical protein
MAVWPFLPHLINPAPPVPGLKAELVRCPTPLLRVPPWREYICHFDKYPGGRVLRPLPIHSSASRVKASVEVHETVHDHIHNDVLRPFAGVHLTFFFIFILMFILTSNVT